MDTFKCSGTVSTRRYMGATLCKAWLFNRVLVNLDTTLLALEEGKCQYGQLESHNDIQFHAQFIEY